jgi:uncharacterized protein (DUF2062 family)
MWIRIASMSLPLTFNKFDWQDFFQGLKFGGVAAAVVTAAVAVAMIALGLFAALSTKRDRERDNSE